jgi:parallel beta-helix repeat protein
MARTILLILIVLASVMVTSPLSGRTWRITTDGTGDAPFIEAAMDSAAVGDTVLVAAGEYEVAGVSMANGAVLLSESGPTKTLFVPYPSSFPAGAIACSGLSANTTIRGFWFDGFEFGHSTQTGAISVHSCASLTISNNIFTNNDYAGVTIDGDFVRLLSNTFSNNNVAVHFHYGDGTCFSNILWDELGNLGPVPVVCNDVMIIEDIPESFRSANFSADPVFCGSGNFGIRPESPCAPGNSPLGDSCGLIGALEVGCGVPVENNSWGHIKTLFHTN